MSKKIVILALMFLFGSFGITYLLYAQRSLTAGSPVHVPRPLLIAPTSETVDIKDKDGILFKWSARQIPSGGRRNFRFQLYEGYDMYEQNLIFKKVLDPFTFEVFVEKDKFKDGSAYTWSVRQRGYFGNWSGRSFHSFRVKR